MATGEYFPRHPLDPAPRPANDARRCVPWWPRFGSALLTDAEFKAARRRLRAHYRRQLKAAKA